MKVYWQTEDKRSSNILSHNTSCRWVVSFRLPPLYSRGKGSEYQLVNLRVMSGHDVDKQWRPGRELNPSSPAHSQSVYRFSSLRSHKLQVVYSAQGRYRGSGPAGSKDQRFSNPEPWWQSHSGIRQVLVSDTNCPELQYGDTLRSPVAARVFPLVLYPNILLTCVY